MKFFLTFMTVVFFCYSPAAQPQVTAHTILDRLLEVKLITSAQYEELMENLELAGVQNALHRFNNTMANPASHTYIKKHVNTMLNLARNAIYSSD